MPIDFANSPVTENVCSITLDTCVEWNVQFDVAILPLNMGLRELQALSRMQARWHIDFEQNRI
jgi:hypothetical protein